MDETQTPESKIRDLRTTVEQLNIKCASLQRRCEDMEKAIARCRNLILRLKELVPFDGQVFADEWNEAATALASLAPAASSNKPSPTQPYVDAFAAEMEKKLAKNRHKGDREGWLKDTPRALFERLIQEVDELHSALADGTDAESVLSEAADVANFAMMIADTYAARDALAPAATHKYPTRCIECGMVKVFPTQEKSPEGMLTVKCQNCGEIGYVTATDCPGSGSLPSTEGKQ